MSNYIFHLPGAKKHIENSIRGIKRAARRLFKWIDIDLLITKADPDCPLDGDPEHVDGVCHGHIVGCHWDRPMLRDGFLDPEGELRHKTKVRDMTLAQVLRLHTKDGYRIRRIKTLLLVCAMRRVGAYVEPKDDRRFEQDWPWIYMKSYAKKFGCRFRMRTLRNFAAKGAGIRRRNAARRNGVRAKTIRG